MIIIAHNDLLK